MKTILSKRKSLIILFFIFIASQINAQSWQQKAFFANDRDFASGFSIGAKGYIGLGSIVSGTAAATKDFWQYDPATDVWTQVADFAGAERRAASSFATGGYGYAGNGWDGTTIYNDFYQYDPVSNTWAKKADYPGSLRRGAVGLAIGAKGYISGGFAGGTTYFSDFYEYDPAADAWTKETDYPGGQRGYQAAFSIGPKGYVGTGQDVNNLPTSDFYEYNPATGVWTRIADYAGTAVNGAFAFSIGAKGFVGTGSPVVSSGGVDEFWQWDQASNTWSFIGSYPGGINVYGVGFAIGSKGYAGVGLLRSDFYEFTPCEGNSTYRPVITLSGSDTVCAATTVTITANDNSSYLWNTGEVTQSINPLIFGGETFYVVNPDSNNCLNPSNRVKLVAEGTFIEFFTNPVFCLGDSIVLQADRYTYDGANLNVTDGDFIWSTGETTRNITVKTTSSPYVSLAECSAAPSVPVYVQVITPDHCLAPDFLAGQPGFAADTINKEIKATFYWTKGVCSNGWQLNYRQVGQTNWVVRNVNPSGYNQQFDPFVFIEVVGLKPGACYEFRVRTQCSSRPTRYSDWTYSFTGPVCLPSKNSPREAQPAHDNAIVIDETLISNLSLAPNPSSDQVNLQFQTGAEHVLMSIFDMTGKKIIEKTLISEIGDYNHTIDVSTLPQGIYLISLNSASDRASVRFVKE